MAQIIQAVQNGNQEEMNELFKELESNIRRMVSFRITNRHDVYDLTQEALIRVYRGILRYKEQGVKFDTWVYRIVQNLCIDHYRRQKPVELMGDQDWDFSSNQNVEKEIVMAELSKELVVAMSRIPSKNQKAFTMKFMQEKSLEEISDELGVPVNTVKSHIHRAKQMLQGLLSHYHMAS